MTRITATEAARNFSDVLNRAAAGEELEIVRNDTTVAVLGPPRSRLVSAARFRSLMSSFPPDEKFADDLRAIRKKSRRPARSRSWPS